MSLRNLITDLAPDRLSRLPVYAQEHILRLQRYVAELTAGMDDLVNPRQDVTTHADPHSDWPKPVGNNPTLRHRMPGGAEVELECGPEKITVTSFGAAGLQPAIAPRVSNVVDIYFVNFGQLSAGK